jgi:hypothetical protein
MSALDDDHPLRDGVDRALAALPGDFCLAGAGTARLVVGPPGAFVLEACTPVRLDVSAARVAGLAVATRAILADHVSWVPFVDGLVVLDGGRATHPAVTVVPSDLLLDTLVQGPEVIDGTVLRTARGLLRENGLGVWRLAVGERIDLVEPAPQSSAP